MATIGQKLLQPESGWKRYDDTHPNIVKTNSESYANTPYYGGSRTQFATDGTIEFDFIGTKIILLSSVYDSYSGKVEISIDGVLLETKEQKSSTLGIANSLDNNHIVWFLKEGLENTRHKVKLKNIGTGKASLDAIDIDAGGELLDPTFQEEENQSLSSSSPSSSSKVGQKLLQPESGWKRYDDTHPTIKYEGLDWQVVNESKLAYNSTLTYRAKEYNQNGKIKFSFKGSKVRILSIATINYNDLKVKVDGVEYESYEYLVEGSSEYQTVVFELDGMSNDIHSVEMYVNSTEERSIGLDAIDIDEDGILLHPVEVLNLPKSFILLKGEYKRFDSDWQTISKTLPSIDTFKIEGMHDLSVFDRKEMKFVIPMDNNTLQGEVLGEGRMFRETIDLKKYIDIRSIKVTTK